MLIAALVFGCAPSSLDVRSPPKVPTTPTGPTTTTPPTTDTPPTTPTGTTPTTPTTTPPDGDPWATPSPPPTLSAAALSDIEADIDAIVASTVATSGVYVIDAENGQVVYEWAPDQTLIPASNTKLFTTGVAFDLLGEDHRAWVSAWGDDYPDVTGRVDALKVVSEHDFTWSTWFYESDAFPADRLADQLWDEGVRSVGALTFAGEVLVEGYQFGSYDWDWHRDAGADVLAAALLDRGISVGPVSTSSSFLPPPGSVKLTERGSPSLAVSAHPLNVYSHNEFADILNRHDGYELWGSSSYSSGAAAIGDWLAGAGVNTAGFELYDGSGLSYGNQVSPRMIVDMQAYLLTRPAGIHWFRTFSTAGVLGTLASRMTGSDTSGRFIGKTGTLNPVIATSGMLYHRHDGHRYLISALMNDVVDQSYARALEDDIVEVIARDNRAAGTRPAQPVLRSVLAPGDGTLVIDWDDVAGANAYVIWLSEDGAVFDRADARQVSGTSRFVAGGLDPDTTLHVRVTATNGAGESDPSDVLSARSAFVAPTVLIVDGFDRWASLWENPRGAGHDFVVPHAAALGDRPFESVANEAVVDGTVRLEDYDLVIWVLGEESSAEETFDAAEQAAVADAVAAGTALFVSGAEIGWDLWELGSAADQAFFSDVLHAAYAGDESDTFTVVPTAGGPLAGVGELGFYSPGTEEVLFADRLAPGAGGVGIATYVGGLGGTAGVAWGNQVMVLGFPFETIDGADTRQQVMDAALSWFGL